MENIWDDIVYYINRTYINLVKLMCKCGSWIWKGLKAIYVKTTRDR